MAGMRAAHPGAYEYEVKASIEAVHRGRGAISWAYPSIVGSGPNATILHYPESERQMQAGELLLVDAACNYQYMSPDITRTYPVSGTFTAAPEGHLRHRPRGAGGRDEGGASRTRRCSPFTTAPWR